MKTSEKAKAFDEIVNMIGLPKEDQEKLPEALSLFIKHHGVMPSLLTLAFNKETGKVVQIAMSEVALKPENYQLLAKITGDLSQQFSAVALEIVKHEAEENKDANK